LTDHILVPLDGSRIAESALAHAASLARLLGARVTLARVPETMVIPVASGGVWMTRIVETEEAGTRAEAYLAQIAASDVLRGLAVDTVTPDYPVASGLLEAIEATGAKLVVMTSHGHSAASRWVFGSIAQKVVRGALVPVYVVRAPEEALRDPEGFTLPTPPVYRSIVVPLDGSDMARAALEPALRIAEAAGAAIHLVTIPTVPGLLTVIPETAGAIPEALMERAAEAEAYLEGVLDSVAGSGTEVTADVEILFAGRVEDGILDFAAQREADLVVLTTHGRGGLQRWLLGSTAERLLAASPVPVWVQRSASD
jgi:nucleotide-binding universal stress UspA family protein